MRLAFYDFISQPTLDVTIYTSDYESADTLINGEKESRIVMLPKQIIHERQINLDKHDAEQIMKAVDEFYSCYKGPQEDTGLDGIGVSLIAELESGRNSIRFWSPDRKRESEYYKLIDPLFSILFKHLNNNAEIRYIEQTQQYFDYGTPIKKVSNSPLTYRVHGLIYDMNTSKQELKQFISELPSSGKIVFDMTNSPGVARYIILRFSEASRIGTKISNGE